LLKFTVDVTDTTVMPAEYGHDRRVYSTDPLDTTVVCTTVVYVLHMIVARWRHTPTKLLPLTSPNPNLKP